MLLRVMFTPHAGGFADIYFCRVNNGGNSEFCMLFVLHHSQKLRKKGGDLRPGFVSRNLELSGALLTPSARVPRAFWSTQQ